MPTRFDGPMPSWQRPPPPRPAGPPAPGAPPEDEPRDFILPENATLDQLATAATRIFYPRGVDQRTWAEIDDIIDELDDSRIDDRIDEAVIEHLNVGQVTKSDVDKNGALTKEEFRAYAERHLADLTSQLNFKAHVGSLGGDDEDDVAGDEDPKVEDALQADGAFAALQPAEEDEVFGAEEACGDEVALL